MIRQCELVERVKRYKPEANEVLLNKAYVYAMHKHKNQKRVSGDPYFSHPLEVAAILADMHMDEATIAVALLHDTMEDTGATREEIDELFGPDLGKLVEGLTKLTQLDLASSTKLQAENFRKLLLAVSEDVRVLLVKLADRLHNMRTLDHMPEERQMRIAQETMEIYAPLAGRMGMQDMREEFENLAFRVINPEAWRTVTERLLELTGKNTEIVHDIEKDLSEWLAKNKLKATISGRLKKPWSVFRKMQDKTLSFEQLSDVFGFRVLVDSVSDCYYALGCIHTAWSMVPGRFKDYISTPKQNDYRSIHTTIMGPSRQRVELQIKTQEMNQVAEYGIAAHALYKDLKSKNGKNINKKELKYTKAYAWLHQTIKQLSEGGSPEDFLENTKLELFQDQVFCFTPKGRLIALPRNATPVDFAYAVHTDIGNMCVGAKVNGRMTPLMVKLQNGDEIEIICSKAGSPRLAWEHMIVTGKARAAIRKWTGNTIRKQYSSLGGSILEQAFTQVGQLWHPKRIEPFLPLLGRKDVEDVLAGVGCGELKKSDVLKAVFPESGKKKTGFRNIFRKRKDGWFNIRNAAGIIFRIPGKQKKNFIEPNLIPAGAMAIRGIQSDLPVRFGSGGAVPGDRILGIFEPGSGITIYPIQSSALASFDKLPECWIDVKWDVDENMKERFPTWIRVVMINAPGSLAKIAEVIAKNDSNIHSLSTGHTAPDFSELIINLEVWHLKNLENILAELKSMADVSEAERTNI